MRVALGLPSIADSCALTFPDASSRDSSIESLASSSSMPTRSHASSLQLSRETRERFVAATEGVIGPVAHAVQERLVALAAQVGNAREMQENRDGFLAFQAH